MLDEGKTQMFNASILEDTTKAREQLNELKGRHYITILNTIKKPMLVRYLFNI